jgi:hypothetical protein
VPTGDFEAARHTARGHTLDLAIDMAANPLWRLAQEQAGETMSPDAFRHWRERKAYTLDEAARAGSQPAHSRVLREGDRPISRVAALATRALGTASTR